MLLRLVPTPSEANPQPPTILFTLPLPSQPYTAKGLPLPSQLLSHRSICMQQGIECSNPLLGDKAAWLFGAISEVTFVTYAQQINIQMHDSTEHWMPLTPECMAQCDKVIEHVSLSFAPQPKFGTVAPISPPMTPSSPRFKTSASPFMESRRQSPSSLLMSLLSPLISSSASTLSDASVGMFGQQQGQAFHQGRPTATSAVQRAANPSKFHRRQARSILVDAFRRFILPFLKNTLPSSYLLLTIKVDQSKKQEEWSKLQDEIEALLTRAEYKRPEGVPSVLRRPSLGKRSNASINVRRARSTSTDSVRSSSTFTRSASSTSTIKPDNITSLPPAMYIATLPAYTEVPSDVGISYATMLRRINDLSSRLASLHRLKSELQLEESQRADAEACETGKNEEKGIRRACSNATIAPIHRYLRPVKSSKLRNCVLPEVEGDVSSNGLSVAILAVEEDVDVFAPEINVRPATPSLGMFASFHEDSSDSEDDEDVLIRREALSTFEDFCISSPPSLVYNGSAESLESDDESPASATTCNGHENEDEEDPMFMVPKTPRLASVSQLPSSSHFDDALRPPSSTLRRSSFDDVDPSTVIPIADGEDVDATEHDEFWVDMLSGRRKSESLPFSWVQQHQSQTATC